MDFESHCDDERQASARSFIARQEGYRLRKQTTLRSHRNAAQAYDLRMHGRLLIFAFLLLSPAAKAQQGPIDPTWVYTTQLQWKHAPRGIPSSETFATVVVLYPEGQYLEILTALIRNDKNPVVGFSHGDGLIIRAGTWSRTDDRVIRTHSRDVFWTPETVSKIKCEQTPEGKRCGPEEPHPGPYMEDTCALEGRSSTHLAQAIHCHRLIVHPSKLSLDQPELRSLSQLAEREQTTTNTEIPAPPE